MTSPLGHFRRFLCFVAAVALGLPARSTEPVSVPRFTHPGAGQTIYFVLTDRFANGSTANDTGGFSGGREEHGFDPAKIGYFHGGDFAGLTARLDYIKGLGASAVWVTPPFRNKPVQLGSAGYHGYWILDFLHVDPHLGTDAEFREFVAQAHARGLKVYLDIIVNHTADVIRYQGGRTDYISKAVAPNRDAAGRPFDERAVAFNGFNAAAFPALSAARSFPYVPLVPAAEIAAKNPAWLNDVTHYHNRGNSTFQGESSLDGDFVGLDDLFTEQPEVVRGFIEIYREWIDGFGADGFRIDTARHVNLEFWQAFAPAIREHARRAGRPGFIQFGEVANDAQDVPLLSAFSTTAPLDAALDFGFFRAALGYVSQGGTAAALAGLFAQDDYYTDHDSNVHTAPTFLGNHDAGRFGYFLQHDNPRASREELARLVEFGHALLFLVRGQPVIYYGDEQGMVGRGGNDMQAREDMFAAQAPDFRDAPLLGTTRTGADDKFDPSHPFYRFIAVLAELRNHTPALSRGAMIGRPADSPNLFAFSRIERNERIEYLAAFNNSRTATVTGSLQTAQPAGAVLQRVPLPADSGAAGTGLTADASGRVTVSLAPLQFALWRATGPLSATVSAPTIAFAAPAAGAELSIPVRALDGHAFPTRQEIRADVMGGDGFAEVTFVLTRKSRPGQYELLGTDDAAPYRVFWCPPPDLAPGEEFSLIASVDDLRGHRAVARIDGLKTAAGTRVYGVKGVTVPVILSALPATAALTPGTPLILQVAAEGTGPLEYQWVRDGAEIPGATEASLLVTAPGRYFALVRNRAGTIVAPATVVSAAPVVALPGARVETLAPLTSQYVAPRRVDVWLPPGYDANAAERYPVVYMHDGQNLFDPATSYGGVPWSADLALTRLMAAGRSRGAIIVGIWNTSARFAEYLPQKAVSAGQYADFVARYKLSSSPPLGDAYLQYLVTELKPFIDRTYRTRPEREHTSTMGSSMGGLISAYAICEYPEVFGGAGCVSIHWPLGDGVIIDWFARHLPKPGAHRLYFDFGTETLDSTYEPYQRRVDAVMRAAGYTAGRDWLTLKFPGAAHSEKSWRERVDLPLAFLLAEPAVPERG